MLDLPTAWHKCTCSIAKAKALKGGQLLSLMTTDDACRMELCCQPSASIMLLLPHLNSACPTLTAPSIAVPISTSNRALS